MSVEAGAAIAAEQGAAPSRADQDLTRRIKQVLELVDVRTLDHVITAGGASQSMAEIGLM